MSFMRRDEARDKRKRSVCDLSPAMILKVKLLRIRGGYPRFPPLGPA
jgi:hypothetical protein